MMKSKMFSVLTVVYFLFFCNSATADDLTCEIDKIPSDLKISSCDFKGGVNVIKLTPNDLSDSVWNDSLSTVIVRSENKEDALHDLGLNSSSPYSRLIKLPDPGSIIEFSDAPDSARIKVAQKSWNVLDMKVVVYKGPQDDDGYTLVCSTFEHNSAQEVILVSQCNDSYESNISNFKNLLGLVMGEEK